MIVELVARWLRSRGAMLEPSPAGQRVTLTPEDALRPALGDTFMLAPTDSATPVAPGIEPLFPGSRITDLLAGDLADVRGIAVAAGAPPGEGPRFLFAYQAVYTADRRSEGLVRVALDGSGSPVPLPPDREPPLCAAGDAAAWQERVAALLPTANREARSVATAEIARLEREAQLRLYRAARRLAMLYRQRRVEVESEDDQQAEFRRMVEAEVDRHRLSVSLTLIGVTVLV